MLRILQATGLVALIFTITAMCQTAPETTPEHHANVPIYSVTVVDRTVQAVDYQYGKGPTPIDFRGTVLLPQAKGDALVDSKAGRAEIDAHFSHLPSPHRFGPEYLTYVLWAITPQGGARNLGEVVANSSDHGRLKVTTDLQAFGMIVTAEPYAAMRRPGDVVVLENQVRPDTMGRTEPIAAKYELLPRGHYTYNVPADLQAAEEQGPMVSMDEYESLLELYQAQNAVQIAKAQHADQYAPDTFQRAGQLLQEAQRLQAAHAGRSEVVTAAREALQTAEDARVIAERREQDQAVAAARRQVEQAQALRAQAEAEAQQARNQAAEADRMAAEAQAQQAAQPVPPPPQPMTQPAIQENPAPAPVYQPEPRMDPAKSELRVGLLSDLSGALPAIDTPRGLVVTTPDDAFYGDRLHGQSIADLDRVALVLAVHPGLSIEVDGYTDDRGNPARAESLTYERAEEVRRELVRAGVPAGQVVARGCGSSRPVASNATAEGRTQNRRVEIVITGEPIGSLAHWDRPYSVTGH